MFATRVFCLSNLGLGQNNVRKCPGENIIQKYYIYEHMHRLNLYSGAPPYEANSDGNILQTLDSTYLNTAGRQILVTFRLYSHWFENDFGIRSKYYTRILYRSV